MRNGREKRGHTRNDNKVGWLRDETRHGIGGVTCLTLALFFFLASLGYAGAAGILVYHWLTKLLGSGFFIVPIVLILLGLAFFRSIKPNFIVQRLVTGLVSFLAMLGFLSTIFNNPDGQLNGGWLGQKIATPFSQLFDIYGLILFVAIIVISLLVMFDATIAWSRFRSWLSWHRQTAGSVTTTPVEVKIANPEAVTGQTKEIKEAAVEASIKKSKGEGGEEEAGLLAKLVSRGQKNRTDKFTPPPLSLLEQDSGRAAAGDIKANANIIKRTLQNFGIVVEMDEVAIGPSITRYALKPAEGVKLSRIVGLQNDLALALAAHPIRIEAPIPGKSLVGIEIPNNVKSRVGLASLLDSQNFVESPHPLLVSLGRSISGTAHFANLARAPHILIAGATGSGKSVVIHTFVTSLLYRNPPDQLRFIMIDPKRVELTVYNHTPHLLTPVVTDAKKAILVLKWAIKEMERRYNILETHSTRDIQSYHQKIANTEETDRLPYIVIIIDELADIMATYPRELEAATVRLAQMSRAVGIHLVLSTQRPSVEVITGLIKANIPSRIALQVASQVDSRTILDIAGAEKLLGAGDLLYLSAEMAKPIRLQSAFISEEEVKKVVNYLAKQYAGRELPTNETVTMAGAPVDSSDQSLADHLSLEEDGGESDDDELYEDAREAVIRAGKASASYLQRRLKVGYARAARLLDMLEERGVIGPGEGARQREVYIKSSNDEVEAEF